jgi:hypothetical protein
VTEREPSKTEVDQVEPEAYLPMDIAVRVEGPVRAQPLPAQQWGVRTFEVPVLPAVRISAHNPRRSRLLIVASALAWIGPVETTAKANVGLRVPASTPMELTHLEDVWAAADTGTAIISVSEEYWAD